MRFVVMAVLVGSLIGCGPSAEEKAVAAETEKLHEEIHAEEKLVKTQLAELDQLKPRLAALKDSLASGPDSLRAGQLTATLAAIEGLGSTYSEWEKTLAQLPHDHEGHDHAEGEAHDHAHDHTPTQATPEQVLEVHKEVKANLLKIKENAATALAGAQVLLK
ncbi:MAG: hypothetical protein MUC97_10895 [Bernardetiaceae bacterium]|jgi:hypothetical protein|nr:hypothetical protein [Bernardetiaceae bacterium]